MHGHAEYRRGELLDGRVSGAAADQQNPLELGSCEGVDGVGQGAEQAFDGGAGEVFAAGG